MSSEPNVVSLAPRSPGTVPRAIWLVGGLLGLVAAALAGALVMRSVDHPTTSAASTTAADAAAQSVASTPGTAPTQPTVTAQPTATAQPTPTAQAKPVHRAKPGTSPQTSAHAGTSPETSAQAAWSPPVGTTSAAVCTSCGIVESVNAVQQKGQGTGLGAVAGGVLGGVVGHQVGGGHGKTAMTVLGAIGGGLAGNEVEKRARSETLFDIGVRMEDGNTRMFRRSQAMAIGTHVVVDGTTLRAAPDNGSADAPHTVRTSAPAGGST
jgi:outer membrane lipoprotein SlyB